MGMKRSLVIVLAALVFAVYAAVLPESALSTTTEAPEEDNSTEEFLNELQAMCLNKTGSNDTFEMLALETAMSPLCFLTKIDLEGFMEGMEILNESNRVPFFTKYCPQVTDAITCVTPLVAHVKKCLDPEEIEVVDAVAGILPEAIQFICRDHGEIFFMDDERLDKCMEGMEEESTKCLEHMSNATDAMDLSNYGEKQCSELAEVRGCFGAHLTGCGGGRFNELIDLFYRPVVQISPCKKFIKLDNLPAIETNLI